MKLTTKIGDRVYRGLLRCWPRAFRDTYGEAAARDFARLAEDAATRKGLRGFVGFCVRGFADVVRTAIRERRAREPSPRKIASRGLWLQHLRDAKRNLITNPGFALLVIGTLGIGIGANSAIFEIVYETLVRPLPFGRNDRLVVLRGTDEKRDDVDNSVTPGDFRDWRAMNTSFEDIAAGAYTSKNLTGHGEPQRLSVYRVSASLFPLFEVDAALGRTFTNDEDHEGASRVAVLSHRSWAGRFGGDEDVVGRDVLLDDEPYRVVGVLPEWFRFPERSVDLFIPIAFTAQERESRQEYFLLVVGRLNDGVSRSAAAAEMSTIALQLEEQYPDTNRGNGVALRPLKDYLIGEHARPLLILLSAVGAVLLIAIVNLANLIFARGTSRQRDIAMRATLGARRSDIVGQLLTESLVLSVAGGAVGIAVAVTTKNLLVRLVPEHVGVTHDAVPLVTLVFAGALSVVVAFAMGFLPALSMATLTASPLRCLRGGTTSMPLVRARNALIVLEVALALSLLTTGGLVLRSYVNLVRSNPGFVAENVLTMRVELARTKYPEHRDKLRFYDELEARIARLPGVSSTGFISMLPLTFSGGSITFSVLDTPDEPDVEPLAVFRSVSANYFRTLGIALREGRVFTDRDRADAPRVAVVSERLARERFAGASAVGRYIDIWGNRTEIVGVVQDAQQIAFGTEANPTIYVSASQSSVGFFDPRDLAIRTDGDPMALADAVRAEIWAIDPNQPIASMQTMQQIVAGATATERLRAALLSAFGIAALILAALGIYGVLSFAVAQRSEEIGVRITLGASVLEVLRLVLVQGMVLTAGGVVLGLLASVVTSRALAGMLHGIEPADPLTWVANTTLLLAVASAACLVPGLRAMRVDPLSTLRQD